MMRLCLFLQSLPKKKRARRVFAEPARKLPRTCPNNHHITPLTHCVERNRHTMSRTPSWRAELKRRFPAAGEEEEYTRAQVLLLYEKRGPIYVQNAAEDMLPGLDDEPHPWDQCVALLTMFPPYVPTGSAAR